MILKSKIYTTGSITEEEILSCKCIIKEYRKYFFNDWIDKIEFYKELNELVNKGIINNNEIDSIINKIDEIGFTGWYKIRVIYDSEEFKQCITLRSAKEYVNSDDLLEDYFKEVGVKLDMDNDLIFGNILGSKYYKNYPVNTIIKEGKFDSTKCYNTLIKCFASKRTVENGNEFREYINGITLVLYRPK